MRPSDLFCTAFATLLLYGLLTNASPESSQKQPEQRGQRPKEANSAENLPCVDFARSACLGGTTSAGLRKRLLAEFNEHLDKELGFAPDVDKMFDDVKAKRPVLEKEAFAKELSRRCDDTSFLKNYLKAAHEEIGDTFKAGNPTCAQMVTNITEIVFSDGRESIDELIDVIRKVRDMIAFDNLRTKNPRMKEAFRLTKEFFDVVHASYLDFVRAFDVVHSTDAYNWHELAKNLELELPMRSNKFFREEQLDVLTVEYFNCTNNWILGIDMRERRLCLSWAWGLAAGEVPIPSRLAQILHDLRSLRVNTESGLVYVRPAYAQLLLNNTTDYAVVLGTLGFEIAREITRASYSTPPNTLLCFEQQLNMKCSEEQVDCKSLQLEYIYDTVALKAVLSILQKTKDADMKKFFYSSPLLTCNHKQLPIDRAVNVVFSQVDDFQIAFGCDESSPMASTTEKQCRLI